jgi:hypothetical protein
MDFLRTRFAALQLLEPSIHIGSAGQAKGPRWPHPGPGRYFAVVAVQTSPPQPDILVFCPYIQSTTAGISDWTIRREGMP